MKNVRIVAWLFCLSFGLLRLAKPDDREGYLVSAGLTGIDAMAVEGLIYFADCLASTTFEGQRQLFLRVNDNYNLDELPMARLRWF